VRIQILIIKIETYTNSESSDSAFESVEAVVTVDEVGHRLICPLNLQLDEARPHASALFTLKETLES